VVYALDPRTRDKTRMFRDDGPCAFGNRPSWSPDGSRLALVCSLEDGTRTGIYLANVTDDLPLDTGLEPVVSDGLTLGAPTWVSDDTFVYAANEDESGETSVLWSYTVGDAGPEQLTTATDGYLTHPDWSEEAERLLFLDHAVPDSDFGTLMTADADLDDIEEHGLTQVANPVWGPDGSLVAFTVLEGGEEVLATAGVDDLGDYTVLPEGPAGDVGAPVWDSR
jgi:Tol biopolymer transport system component